MAMDVKVPLEGIWNDVQMEVDIAQITIFFRRESIIYTLLASQSTAIAYTLDKPTDRIDVHSFAVLKL